ncbi:hypothetical protein AQUCO_04200151v1 [Aquilegia coerulea]|uniref:Sec7/BIG1-like C-terminal domain-containing protein n=1 Tax=Aquilegia coerulea TaxID=218851 RepID=A0A2G5CPH9_AQUCA|nr:hypothetical protein AQUCO_04200151v1 [Aquilegia coerulea]PIA33202.1 hypothetical protein AQUCO_04200151v1 [Aquilegia coerulea]
MDILLSVLEFSASYNSYSNLRMRMHHVTAERPPLNLLRQELAGTSIYLDILQKATSASTTNNENAVDINVSHGIDVTSVNDRTKDEKLEGVAEEKLVSFCGQILKEASELQSGTGESANVDIHRVLELRSPIIVKVIKGMCLMNSHIFKKHLREFYPLITKLVCSDQMDVRGAVGDLFSMQLTSLLP